MLIILRGLRRALRILLSVTNRLIRKLTPQHPPQIAFPDGDHYRMISELFLGLDQLDVAARDYVKVHLHRLVITAYLVPEPTKSKRCLELGSYMHMAAAIKRFNGYQEIRAANFGQLGETIHKTTTVDGCELLTCEVELFDVESDLFPYPDGYFELVLACEMIEHLKRDPMHMLFEIYRVLETDGWLLLTTPNCASIASLECILYGTSNPYTYSLYPRPESNSVAGHIREYTPDELRRVLNCAGFDIEFLFTDSDRSIASRDIIDDLLRNYGFPPDLRGEQIFCLAKKRADTARIRYPSFLYEQ